MPVTTDRNNPGLNKVKENGQNESYLVLSDEERAKGFVRPLRTAYVHVGKDIDRSKMIPIDEYFKANEKEFSADRRRKFKHEFGYIGFIPDEDTDSAIVGRYVTQEDLEGGCGEKTRINIAIAETYARDPKFYGSTFCTGCGKHLPVEEFVWEGTNQRVGS